MSSGFKSLSAQAILSSMTTTLKELKSMTLFEDASLDTNLDNKLFDEHMIFEDSLDNTLFEDPGTVNTGPSNCACAPLLQRQLIRIKDIVIIERAMGIFQLDSVECQAVNVLERGHISQWDLNTQHAPDFVYSIS